MKKFLFVLFVICLLFCTACNTYENEPIKSSKYTSYVTDMANDGLIINAEKEWWNGKSMKVEDVAKRRSFIVDGEKKEFNYKHSQYIRRQPQRTDVYRNDEVEVWVSSVDETVKGYYYHHMITDDYYEKKDVSNPYEFALQKAKEVASKYVNIEEYRVEEEIVEDERSTGKMTYYIIRFVKYIDTIRTSDYVYIGVTSKGDVREMYTSNIGIFDHIETETIDLSEVELSVKNKLELLYGEKKTYSYTIVEQTMAYSPEEDLVLESVIEVEVELDNGSRYNTGVVISTVVGSGNVPMEWNSTKEIASITIDSLPENGQEKIITDKRKIEQIRQCICELTLVEDFEEKPDEYSGATYCINVLNSDGSQVEIVFFGNMFIKVDDGKWLRLDYDEAIELEELLLQQ